MGISKCTACQLGGQEALQAYDRSFALKRNEQAEMMLEKTQATNKINRYDNQPITGAAIDSKINISA